MDQDRIDESLGITRCARCGQRLNGEIECPFCSLFPEPPLKKDPGWIYITACFLTSPLSLYFVMKNKRLTKAGKVAVFSGCLLWFGLYYIFF